MDNNPLKPQKLKINQILHKDVIFMTDIPCECLCYLYSNYYLTNWPYLTTESKMFDIYKWNKMFIISLHLKTERNKTLIHINKK